MGSPDSDPAPEPMLIVRHERDVDGDASHERFWLGDLTAADDVAAVLELHIDAGGARLTRVRLGARASPDLRGRLVGAALRELVGRGVTRVVVAEAAHGDVAGELLRLGFEARSGPGVWEAGGAG